VLQIDGCVHVRHPPASNRAGVSVAGGQSLRQGLSRP
jgi:hypothetical protein